MQETERDNQFDPWEEGKKGWEDPLEEGMAIHSSIFAWKIPWTERPSGLQSMESREIGHD